MGNLISIVGGIIAILIGIVLVGRWLPDVIIGIKFCLIGALICGGLMAILFGIIEFKDARELKRMEKEEKEAKG